MIISYKALKKSKNDNPSSIDPQKKTKLFYNFLGYLSATLVGFLFASFAFNFFRQILLEDKKNKEVLPKNKINVQPKETIPVLSERKSGFHSTSYVSLEDKKVSTTPLQLSGIFYDRAGSYVIINNRILKKGDCIKGYCIREIFLDRVELESEGKILELNLKD